MSRALLTGTVVAEGNTFAIANALLHVYLPGTTSPVSGMYLTEVGGSPVTTLTTDTRGNLKAWFDDPQIVDLKVTDNSNAAYKVGEPSTIEDFADFTVTLSTSATLPPLDTADPLTVSTILGPATVGVAYAEQLDATGGEPGYTWALIDGTLPAGLSLSSGGLISGIPTTAGLSTFTVEVEDGGGRLSERSLSIKVAAAPAAPPSPIVVTSSSLLAGAVGSPYSQALTATGGSGPYQWSIIAGVLPTGISLSSGGLLTGTPTVGGYFTVTFSATDGVRTGLKVLTLTVTPIPTSGGGGDVDTPELGVDTDGVPYFDPGGAPLGDAFVHVDTDGVPYFELV